MKSLGAAVMLLAALIAASPPAAEAQQAGRIHRVGVLIPSEAQWERAVFVSRLRELGYVEGTNLALDVRDGDGRLERMPAMAQSLIGSGPDVIVALNTPGTAAAIAATPTIPIVMSLVGDPVSLGFVSNLARPGGNVTGVSNQASDLVAKRLALFSEAVPTLRRVAVLLHPDEPIAVIETQQIEAPARQLGLALKFFPMRTTADLEQVMRTAAEWKADGVFRLSGQANTLADETVALAMQYRIPFMGLQAPAARAGALLSYFGDQPDLHRLTADYVDRILKGAHPGELPIQQPTKFEMVVNLRTARALGIAIPQAVLLRADEVIE
jgi:putative ABC transport system substrate-binding protein